MENSLRAPTSTLKTGLTTVGYTGFDEPGRIMADTDGSIWFAAYSSIYSLNDDSWRADYRATLTKFRADGKIDTTFNDDGKSFLGPYVSYWYGGAAEFGGGAAAQSGGKYLVIDSGSNATVAQYNMDGSLDTHFGEGGRVVTPVGDDAQNAIAVLNDGSILVGFSAVDDENYTEISHLTPDGKIDTNFAGDGRLEISGVGNYSPFGITLQQDGKVLVTSTSGVVRVNPDGTLDSAFGLDGVAPYSSGSLSGVTVQGDGKVLVLGSFENGAGIYRLNSNGSLDTTFGGRGGLPNGFAAEGINGKDAVVLADGNILVSGTVSTTADGTILGMMRLNPDGSIDTTFGNPDDGYKHLDGGVGNDLLVGTKSYNDVILGGEGNDVIDGRAGRDVLIGGDGNDVFRFSSVLDSYRNSEIGFSDRIRDFDAGEDVLDLSALGFTALGNGHEGTLTVRVNAEGTRTYLKNYDTDPSGQRFEIALDGNLSQQLNEFNILFSRYSQIGSDAKDHLVGVGRTETLIGLSGNDTLIGSLGNTLLDGGTGQDSLVGGGGADTFRFGAVTDSYRTDSQKFVDRVFGFEQGVDTIDVSALGFVGLGSGHNGTLEVKTNSDNTVTYLRSLDPDASGARFEVSFQGSYSFQSESFIFTSMQLDIQEMQLLGVPLVEASA